MAWRRAQSTLKSRVKRLCEEPVSWQLCDVICRIVEWEWNCRVEWREVSWEERSPTSDASDMAKLSRANPQIIFIIYFLLNLLVIPLMLVMRCSTATWSSLPLQVSVSSRLCLLVDGPAVMRFRNLSFCCFHSLSCFLPVWQLPQMIFVWFMALEFARACIVSF